MRSKYYAIFSVVLIIVVIWIVAANQQAQQYRLRALLQFPVKTLRIPLRSRILKYSSDPVHPYQIRVPVTVRGEVVGFEWLIKFSTRLGWNEVIRQFDRML